MKGTVFTLPIEGSHPYIVVSDEKGGYYLVVNVSDADKHPDCPCFIEQGEHAAITKRSAVLYKKAQELPAKGFAETLKKTTVYEDRVTAAVLQRIRDGAYAKDSELTLKLRRYFE